MPPPGTPDRHEITAVLPSPSPPPPAAETAAVPSKDDFYSDPLITEALRLFHGKLQE